MEIRWILGYGRREKVKMLEKRKDEIRVKIPNYEKEWNMKSIFNKLKNKKRNSKHVLDFFIFLKCSKMFCTSY